MMKKTADGSRNRLLPFCLLMIICICSVYFFIFCPVPRQIGLTFRNTLYVLPLIFLAALSYSLIGNRIIHVLITGILFSFVLLPYSGLINSGASDQYALGGVIPWSDAFTMQLNTQRFLYGGMMGQSSALRPLSLVFYAVFLRLFDNNYFALQVFLCILTSFCMISALGAVSRSYGAACGAAAYTILYYYIRQRLGTFMTEPYGFICGLLSCIWILRGMQQNKQKYMLAGFLFLSIGMNARPAAMFLFPALGLWYFFVYLKGKDKRVFYSACALILMLSGFLFNRIAQIAVYGEKKIPNRQAAEMVYGLCLGGKSWGDVVASPEMIALNQSDNILKDLSGLCIPVLKEHPENILSALKTIFVDSLIRSEYYGAFSYVNGSPAKLNTFIRYGMMLLWLSGIFMLIKKRNDPMNSLLLWAATGIILSECAAVPFSSNYLRLYAVSMWIPACITGIPLESARRLAFSGMLKKDSETSGVLPMVLPAVTGMILFIGAVFGAPFIRAVPFTKPQGRENICQPGEEILLTSVDPGSYIYLDEKKNLTAEHIPYFRLPYVRQHIHDTASIEMFHFTDMIDTPTAIIRGIDLGNNSDVLIFAPLEMVEGENGYAQFCGSFINPPILRNDRFFIPDSVFFIEDNL